MQLSPHFSLAEMTKTSQPYANVPSPHEIAALEELCVHVLEPIRAHFNRPVRVTSGYRSLRVNRAVGSKDGSQHRRGEAADIEIAGVANGDLATWIRDALKFDQLILEAYHRHQPNSGWVHVSYCAEPYMCRRDVRTMVMGSHGPVYSKGLTL